MDGTGVFGRIQTSKRHGVPHTCWLNWLPTKETKSAKGERRGSLLYRNTRTMSSANCPSSTARCSGERYGSSRTEPGMMAYFWAAHGLLKNFASHTDALTKQLREASEEAAADRPARSLSAVERHQQGADRSRDRRGGRRNERTDLHSYRSRSLSAL